MTIDFIYNTDFKLDNEPETSAWILDFCKSESFTVDFLVFAFFSDEALRALNIKHLSHDYYTDVISFDESTDKTVKGNIAISTERVADNAKTFSVSFEEELRRVMIHGVLHFMGYNDSSLEEKTIIRNKEDRALKMFHVKQ